MEMEQRRPDRLTSERVFIGVPTYDGRVSEGVVSGLMVASARGLAEKIQINSYSWLTQNFNSLLCAAMNERKHGITHFVLLHEDVVPEPFWLDKMIDIMKERKADVLSAIIPIKTHQGITSTALDEYNGGPDRNMSVRRLTLHECFTEFEPTFTHPDLLLNTGLMMIDVRRRWIEECILAEAFQFKDRIVKDQAGNLMAIGLPEDWGFSRAARRAGAALFATREIGVQHIGKAVFVNRNPWGSAKTDKWQPPVQVK